MPFGNAHLFNTLQSMMPLLTPLQQACDIAMTLLIAILGHTWPYLNMEMEKDTWSWGHLEKTSTVLILMEMDMSLCFNAAI